MPRPSNIFMKVVGAFFYWLSWLVVQFLARIYWRGTIKGLENVPKTGPFVVAPVHRSNADGPLVVILTRRRMRYMSKDGMFKIHWLGQVFRAMGAFPVNREVVDRAALKTAADVLERGEPLVLFPEGSRKSGDKIEDLHEGAVYLAMKAGAPIVPVGIGNSDKANPKGKLLLRPVKIRMIVGEPIRYQAPESGRISRSEITAHTQLLQTRLQDLYDQSLGKKPIES